MKLPTMRILDWLWIAIGLAWVVLIAIDISQRKRAGPVLLDLGGSERRQLYFGGGFLLVAIGCLAALTSPRSLFQGLAFMAWGVGHLAMATRRFQVRQAGVLGQKLYRWQDILEYHVDSKGCLLLRLRPGKKPIRCSGHVDYERRQEVNDLLAAKVATGDGARNPE